MKNNEREKVIEAARGFCLNGNRGDYTFYEDLADFHLEQTKELRRQHELDKAVQQFIGFGHQSKGYNVVQLVEAMGLTKKEFLEIRDDISASLPKREFEEVEDYFRRGEGVSGEMEG